MVLANLFAVSSPMGIAASLVLGFVDDQVDRLLGLDGRHEVSLALAPLGQGPADEPASGNPPAIDPKVLPLSRREVEYADAIAAHEASRLRSIAEVTQWKSRR
jgi:hypothetical protein